MKWKDMTGFKSYQLTALYHNLDNRTRWICQCDCGNLTEVAQGNLASGTTKSCGCRITNVLKDRNTKHNLSKLPEYKIWKGIKKRCFNKNENRYDRYGGRGITMHPDFVNDFEAWFKEVGPRPPDKWGIGRIDNDGDYTYGNMQWETYQQQARNHSKQKNNTSGITGIKIRTRLISGNYYTSVTACWNDSSGKKKTKDFSADKYGKEEAIRMAIEYRENKLKQYDSTEAPYAKSHGKGEND